MKGKRNVPSKQQKHSLKVSFHQNPCKKSFQLCKVCVQWFCFIWCICIAELHIMNSLYVTCTSKDLIHVQCCARRGLQTHFCVQCDVTGFWGMLLIHVIYQNDQQRLLFNLITRTSSHMTVTWEKMAVIEAGSRVNFSIGISTNRGKQLSYFSRNISTWSSNYRTHHRLSATCRSWNTQQKGCFGGAPALASANGQGRENSSQISQPIPK